MTVHGERESLSHSVKLLSFYDAKLQAEYASGKHIPIILPFHLFGILVVIAYLLLPPSSSSLARYGRLPIFALFTWWCIKGIREIRSAAPHVSYGVGIIGAWSIIWIAALMLWRDARTDLSRIWPVQDSGSYFHSEQNSEGKGSDQLFWQALPSEFWSRLHWIADLGISLRAPGWSHASNALPPPPKRVLSALSGPTPPNTRSYTPNVRTFSNRDELIKHTLATLVICYLALDILKVCTMQDPYFLGYVSSPSPFVSSWFITRTYRSVVSMCYVGIALQTIFALNPWFFAYVCGPDRFLRLGIKAEAWLYPGMFGSFSRVWIHGLTGFWSMWWHQIFRVGFSAPVEWYAQVAGWDVRGKDKAKAKAFGAVVAFGFSGMIHAAGSWTSLGGTNPIHPLLFFVLQGIAVIFEGAVNQVIHDRDWLRDASPVAKQAATFVYVLFWLLATAPLLCDDFARSGVWLFEPVAVSPIRGLLGQGWVHWNWRVFRWYIDKDGRWWRNGIALW